MTLTEIIERLEKATKGSRELDGEIYRAIRPDISENDWLLFNGVWHSRDPRDAVAFDIPLEFTTSIDSALTLVPEGANCWGIEVTPKEIMGYVSRNYVKKEPGSHWLFEAYAKTPALALCIASLKARITENGN